jgi:hypothetical protein
MYGANPVQMDVLVAKPLDAAQQACNSPQAP